MIWPKQYGGHEVIARTLLGYEELGSRAAGPHWIADRQTGRYAR